jgi:hypothetical protein
MMAENQARNLLELSGARQQPQEISGERRGSELVPQTQSASVVEFDDQVRHLGAAVLQLQTVCKQMVPDDLVFEFSQDSTAQRSTTRLRLRAYRKSG